MLAFNHLPCYYSGIVLARGNKTGEFYSRYFRKVKKKKKSSEGDNQRRLGQEKRQNRKRTNT